MAVNMAQNVLDPLALDEPCAEEEEETEDNTQSVWEHDPLAQVSIAKDFSFQSVHRNKVLSLIL